MKQAELNFDGQNTLYATHGLHAFAAKCPPQLVGYALEQYSEPGEVVLDPMVGSGTLLVEARLLGRNAIGYDFDPLTRLIAQVKSQFVADNELDAAGKVILENATADLEHLEPMEYSEYSDKGYSIPEFHNRDYWFNSSVSLALTVLSNHIASVQMSSNVRDFMWVVFSSLILARTSVANARDIIHSRHHHFQHAEEPDVLARFSARLKRMRKQMAEFGRHCEMAPQESSVESRLGDARELDLGDESVDLVFTSPPYATALDYPRAHFLAIPWMEPALEVDFEGYRSKAPKYIGSQRGSVSISYESEARLMSYDQTQKILADLKSISSRQFKLCHRYFLDMDLALAEMARVLRQRRRGVIVVCPSHIRKIEVPTHKVLIEIAASHGLALEEQHIRTINERRRVMPYISAFGKRMSTEYVLVFQKR